MAFLAYYAKLLRGMEDPENILMLHIIKYNSASVDGVFTPGTAHARPSAQPPIDTSRIFPPHVSAESHSNILPNPSEVISEVLEPKDNF